MLHKYMLPYSFTASCLILSPASFRGNLSYCFTTLKSRRGEKADKEIESGKTKSR